jgi:hypothetical protein
MREISATDGKYSRPMTQPVQQFGVELRSLRRLIVTLIGRRDFGNCDVMQIIAVLLRQALLQGIREKN